MSATLLAQARALPPDAGLVLVVHAAAPPELRHGDAWEVPGLGTTLLVTHLEDGTTVVEARAGDVVRRLDRLM